MHCVLTAGGVEHFDAFGLVETGQGSRRGIVASTMVGVCTHSSVGCDGGSSMSGRHRSARFNYGAQMDWMRSCWPRVVPIPGFDPDEWKDDQSAVFRVRYRNGANMARISSEKICGSSQAAK